MCVFIYLFIQKYVLFWLDFFLFINVSWYEGKKGVEHVWYIHEKCGTCVLCIGKEND